MSHGFAQHHCIALTECSSSLTVEAIDGRPLGIRHVTALMQELVMQMDLLHTETIQFYILPTSTAYIILGLPWLRRHDPHISWREGLITHWNKAFHPECLSHVSPLSIRTIHINERSSDTNLPEEYKDLSVAFSKVCASKLPPHRPYDCAIDIIPGSTPAKICIFPLSQSESKAMNNIH